MDTVAVTIDLPIALHEKLQEIMELKNRDLHSLIVHYLKEGIPAEDVLKAKQKHFQHHAEAIMKQHAMPPAVIDEIVEKFNFNF